LTSSCEEPHEDGGDSEGGEEETRKRKSRKAGPAPARKSTARKASPARKSRSAPAPAVQLAKWQQCGGKGGDCNKAGFSCMDAQFPGVACPAGTACKKQNEWYYQCI
jgi:hypothetical protein